MFEPQSFEDLKRAWRLNIDTCLTRHNFETDADYIEFQKCILWLQYNDPTQNWRENIAKATAKSINEIDPAIIKAQEACSSLKDAYDMFDTKYEIKQDLDEI